MFKEINFSTTPFESNLSPKDNMGWRGAFQVAVALVVATPRALAGGTCRQGDGLPGIQLTCYALVSDVNIQLWGKIYS